MKNLGLYIHIPFCKRKCIYCAFVSFCNQNDKINSYFEKLKEELLFHKKEIEKKVISSIYIGGGTPSYVSAELIFDLMGFIKQHFKFRKDIEITIEANPDSVTLKKAKIWKNCGINRVSVGLQSINDKTLKLLNRPHNLKSHENAIKILNEVGFTNINSDILIGLMGQTKDEIKQTIKYLKNLNLTHISAYGLMVEEDTKLFDMINKNQIELINEEQSVKLYNFVCNELKKNGYFRYEISNFCKFGFECKHNQNYWNRGEFLGIGLSAYSFLNGIHYENTKILEEYLNKPYKQQNIEKETLKTKKEEIIMLSLRQEKGLDIQKFNKMFHLDFLKIYEKQIKKLLENNFIEIKNNHLKIVNFEVSNYIISEFF